MPDGLVWTPTPVVSLDELLVIMPHRSIKSIWDNRPIIPRRDRSWVGFVLFKTERKKDTIALFSIK